MADDAELIGRARSGTPRAVEELFRRHAGAAIALARSIVRDSAEAEGIAIDTFAQVIRVIENGGGPDHAFRPYLLRSVRNRSIDHARRQRRIQMIVVDVATAWQFDADIDGVMIESRIVARHRVEEPVVALIDAIDSDLARAALALLPDRARTMLELTDVQGIRLGEAAAVMGLDPGAAAALRYRAHEKLRQAFLVVSVPQPSEPACRECVMRLGAFVRGRSSRRVAGRVVDHLASCARCTEVEAAMRELNASAMSTRE